MSILAAFFPFCFKPGPLHRPKNKQDEKPADNECPCRYLAAHSRLSLHRRRRRRRLPHISNGIKGFGPTTRTAPKIYDRNSAASTIFFLASPTPLHPPTTPPKKLTYYSGLVHKLRPSYYAENKGRGRHSSALFSFHSAD